MSIRAQLSLFDMVSAANYQEIDGGVKVLRQKDETKNKKKITETEVETKISELFSEFQTVLLSEQEDAAVIPSSVFTKNKKSVNKTMRFLKPDC